MALRKYFGSIYTAPLTIVVASRDTSLYLLRSIFYMGIRPLPKRYTLLYILWALALNLASTVYQPIGFLLSYISHMDEFTPGELLTSLQVSLNAWSCSAKVILVWMKVHHFDEANDVLDEIDKRCTRKDEQQKIRVTVTNSNRIFFIMIVIYFSYATTTFLSAVLNGKPPYQNYYPILDWHVSRTQFWIQAFLEYFAMCGACFQDVCADCYPVNYILILRTHINILTERVHHLGTDEYQNNDDIYEELIKCIEDHKNILRFCDTLRPIISGTIFIQFLAMGVVLGLTLINLVLFADFVSALGALMFLCAVLCETTPLCILCSFLIDDCDILSNAAFESNWLRTNKRYRMVLIYFIQNLQKPIVFNAANFVPINVGTNISIVKFSFSVFTFVKQMNIVERLSSKTN